MDQTIAGLSFAKFVANKETAAFGKSRSVNMVIFYSTLLQSGSASSTM
jgi:hypothetical protein